MVAWRSWWLGLTGESGRQAGLFVDHTRRREHLDEIFHDVTAGRVEEMLAGESDEALGEFMEWVHSTFPIALRAEDVKSLGDDAEVVTSAVVEKVRGAYVIKVRSEDETRHAPQNMVAHNMPVRVVHNLEQIQVHHTDAAGLTRAPAPFALVV